MFHRFPRPFLASALGLGLLASACAGAGTTTDQAATTTSGPDNASTETAVGGDAGSSSAHASCAADVGYLDIPDRYAVDGIARYTELVMDGETVMRFAIGETVTDAQVERAVRVTRSYLTDVEGSRYGADKSAVRSRLASEGGLMLVLDGADGDAEPPRLGGQPLYAAEIAAEGSPWYTDNDFQHRDATLEEVFHQIHDVGIGTDQPGALPDYQQEILAEAEANKGESWGIGFEDWLAEIEAEGSLAQEYIAAVIDSWYGMWGPWQGERGMYDGYIAKTRADIIELDPVGAELVQAFLPETLEYEAYIDPAFDGTFQMGFDDTVPYTHKSQYLRGARLTGDNSSALAGNELDNTLRGNGADNTLDGGAGTDTAVYCAPEADYTITTTDAGTTVAGPDGTDTLVDIEIIRFADTSVEL